MVLFCPSLFLLFNFSNTQIWYYFFRPSDMEISTNDQYHDEKERIPLWNTNSKDKRDTTYIRITSKKVILLLTGYI